MSQNKAVSVLLVEDELLASKMVCAQISRLGYEVVGCASNANEALEMIRQSDPALILMDLQMIDPQTGEEDPRAGIRATQAILRLSPKPVVIITAYETEELLQEASEAGAVGYLVKPVNDNELNRAISIALARFSDFIQLRFLNEKLAQINAEMEEEINERRKAEQAEREQRVLAEALRDIGAALNSTLELSEVIQRILLNIGRVLPHDAASIMRIHGGIAQTIGFHGYSEGGDGKFETSLSVRVRDIPNLQWIVDNNQPLVIPSVNKTNWVDLPTTAWIRSFVGAPLRVKGKVIGFLNLHSATDNFFSVECAERLQSFTDQAAIAIENARLYSEVQRLAIVDETTGLYNRRGLVELGQREVERVRRFNRSLSAIFLDIDHFKKINDSYGHKVGDEILLGLAACIRSEVREIDLVTRYGGEEFVILLPENDLESAWQVAERLRQTVETHTFSTSRGNLAITISLGVASASLETPSLSALVEQADRAMYVAKGTGRNQVSVV